MVTDDLTLVVISFYDRRPLGNLVRLLESIKKYEAGVDYSICVVVNRTTLEEIHLDIDLGPLTIYYRDNSGMNIGAWDYGWRNNPGYAGYLFLQDECYIVKDNWLSSFKKKAADLSIGLIGESLNMGWDFSWEDLRNNQKDINLPDHVSDVYPANRVDIYLQFLKEKSINPGLNGLHLRSLVWYMREETLSKIDGFPIGNNFGECIASEIGVSKKVEGIGLTIKQIRSDAFHFIRHIEWGQVDKDSDFTKINHQNNQEERLFVFLQKCSPLKLIKMLSFNLRVSLKKLIGRVKS